MVSAHYLQNYCSQSFHISHVDWSWWRHDLYWFFIYWVKSQGHKGSFYKIMVSIQYIEKYLSQSYYIPYADGLGEAMTSWNFGFTRLKVKVRRVTCKKCTHGLCSLSWELFITYLSNFICWLVIEAWPILKLR